MTITLNAGQEAASSTFIQFLADPSIKEMVLEGPAGTGKSTLVRHLIESLHKNQEFLKLIMGDSFSMLDKTYFTATTHKAAHVLASMLGTEVKTIHGLLKLKLKNNFSTGETYLQQLDKDFRLEPGLILIDEASFIDVNLLNYIRHHSEHCKVLYIGDPYQLAPTGMKDSIVFQCNMLTARLTDVVRNDGAIESLAAKYRETVQTRTFFEVEPTGSEIIHADGATFQKLIDDEYLNGEGKSKILAWSNARVHDYNNYVLDLLGFTETITSGTTMITNKPIEINKKAPIPTDSHVRILQTAPAVDRDIEGHMVSVGEATVFVPNDQRDAKALMRYYAKENLWRDYFYIKDAWGDLRPTYACTVHKSQGSTYEKVFIDLSDIGRCNIYTDVARMLYVAISRASKQVILYGQLPPKYRGIIDENTFKKTTGKSLARAVA